VAGWGFNGTKPVVCGASQKRLPGQVAPQGRGAPQPPIMGTMANQAKMTVRVTSSRGASNINFSTAGAYISLSTNGISESLPRSPIQPTSSAKAFWLSVLAIVTSQVNALP
jgi:hypothetical protein